MAVSAFIPSAAFGDYSTWTNQTAAGSRNWYAITSSSDGTKLAAAVGGPFGSGDIYTSTDSGAHWTDQTLAGSRNWYAITSSSDGTKLAAVDDTPGDIWTYVYTPTGPGRRIYLHGKILLQGVVHL